MTMQNYQKINAKVALLLAFVLLLLLVSTVVELVQQFSQQDVSIKPFSRQVVNNSPKLNLSKHIFGTLNLPVKAHKSIKKTRLNLTLVGVLSQKNHALAIIKQNNKEKIYKINDAISASASVKAIYETYIIINHNGNDEKLSIKYRTAFKQAKTAKSKVKQKTKVTAIKKITKQPSLSEIVVIKSTDKSRLKEILSNPKKILSAIAIQPNYENDNLHGFVVGPGKESALFKKIGLKPGDIIVIINGIKLDGWLKLVPLRRELSRQNFDFVIERGNKQHFLSINLN